MSTKKWLIDAAKYRELLVDLYSNDEEESECTKEFKSLLTKMLLELKKVQALVLVELSINDLVFEFNKDRDIYSVGSNIFLNKNNSDQFKWVWYRKEFELEELIDLDNCCKKILKEIIVKDVALSGFKTNPSCCALIEKNSIDCGFKNNKYKPGKKVKL